MDVRSKAKHNVVEAMLELGNVRLGVNPRLDGVVLPVQHMSRDYVALDYGDDVPVFNLSVTERGISATLSFDERPFDTFVPWTAVFAISSDRGEFFFHEEAPAFLRAAEAVEQQAVACAGIDSADGVDAFDADVPTQTRRTRPAWLQLV